MNKEVEKLLDKNIVYCSFSIPVNMEYLVTMKDLINEYNKELKWKVIREKIRDEEGSNLISFTLVGKVKIQDVEDITRLTYGCIKDTFLLMDIPISQDVAKRLFDWSKGFTYGIDAKHMNMNLIDNKLYAFLLRFEDYLTMFVDVNDLLMIETKYPKIVEKVFGDTIQNVYENDVKYLNKLFIDKERLELAKKNIKRLEKSSNIKKLDYKWNKFRINLQF